MTLAWCRRRGQQRRPAAMPPAAGATMPSTTSDVVLGAQPDASASRGSAPARASMPGNAKLRIRGRAQPGDGLAVDVDRGQLRRPGAASEPQCSRPTCPCRCRWPWPRAPRGRRCRRRAAPAGRRRRRPCRMSAKTDRSRPRTVSWVGVWPSKTVVQSTAPFVVAETRPPCRRRSSGWRHDADERRAVQPRLEVGAVVERPSRGRLDQPAERLVELVAPASTGPGSPGSGRAGCRASASGRPAGPCGAPRRRPRRRGCT